jgi:hypothetical protein
MTLVELPMADWCCGFGGTFAIKNADTSTAMLADKMTNVIASGTEVCTAGDLSCLMQIGGGLGRIRSGVRTVHLAEIFAATDKIEQYIESFNSRVRDECLNVNIFWSLAHARVVIADWKDDYNYHRRHSALGYQTPASYAAACTRR